MRYELGGIYKRNPTPAFESNEACNAIIQPHVHKPEPRKDFLIKEPVEFGKQFFKTFRYYVKGVKFLGENSYEPQHKIRSNVVRMAGYAIAPFLLVGIMGVFFSCC